jgi:hypothetical protein
MNNAQIDQEFKFTKKEINNVYYLDLSVPRLNNNLCVGVYRIPTQTDTTLHFTSNHPMEHEFAAYIFSINMMADLSVTERWNGTLSSQ